ncbi:hypothetical protein [Geomobilimonas luticola]|uniref:TIGR02757 family protein n=1 Tax=Geomobilimonas luticola TaxID=1114878 RepID=A0ABS5SC23_9BACT|nr:hypothetical protein [Geomobilimonas luticola]MBT0652909.1 hypothetical protein [Geomobilimonas luticola]
MTIGRQDQERIKAMANKLHTTLISSGILGKREMPEYLLPLGVEEGSLEHILFITLTVSLDYQRDADTLWKRSRMAYQDERTRYLFDPKLLHEVPYKTIKNDLQKHNVSQKITKDAEIWRTVGVTFYKKWEGDPRKFLADCNWDCPEILSRLKDDSHQYNGRIRRDFPYLRGNKIGPLWVRMLRDNVGISELRNLNMVPIPVDIHVARASMALGVVRGRYNGNLEEIYDQIRFAWREGVLGIQVKNREMVALDMDLPLWLLSRNGCTSRDKVTGICPKTDKCPIKEFCVPGRIDIKGTKIIIDT